MPKLNLQTIKVEEKARLIASIWLGILGYLAVCSALSFSDELKSIRLMTLLSLIVSIFYFILGYYYSYKVLLLPASQLNSFPLKCTAAWWSASVVSILILMIVNPIDNKLDNGLFIVSGIILVGFLFGWFILYRLLNYPKINNYRKEMPTLTERIVASTWFGLFGFIIANSFFYYSNYLLSIYIFFLSAYLGFNYGWRILLLPFSLKAFIKSIVIGFVGSSYALIITIIILICGTLLVPTIPMAAKQVSGIHAFMDPLIGRFLLMFFIFPIISFFVCMGGIIISILLYFVSHISKRILRQ